ncbi:MAG: tRNA pseudouridine(55) synthase TruB [Lachnospiraceae bacterium]|nr:tRNA pseudouridine(55) synthase TruB [Candidatus Fimimorpha excrementavium]
MDGILNIYKEKGFTSHDVVAKLRGILRQRKIGHTGTLDPDAEGVLPVCLGNATKVCDMLMDTSKTYRTTMLLGTVTDTQDISGNVQSRTEAAVTEDEVREAIGHFLGGYDQIPPMYSAKKINGKKLYELAREGKELERPACHVEIYEITVEELCLPYVTMTVSCSKGTYIRTLCHDIGARLGCGGCMTKLLRTRVSLFSLEQARKLSEIEKLRDEGNLERILFPLEAVFRDLPSITVSKEGERFLYNGNPLIPSNLSEENGNRDGSMVRVYDAEGQFCAVYGFDLQRGQYRPQKMFLPR